MQTVIFPIFSVNKCWWCDDHNLCFWMHFLEFQDYFLIVVIKFIDWDALNACRDIIASKHDSNDVWFDGKENFINHRERVASVVSRHATIQNINFGLIP